MPRLDWRLGDALRLLTLRGRRAGASAGGLWAVWDLAVAYLGGEMFAARTFCAFALFLSIAGSLRGGVPGSSGDHPARSNAWSVGVTGQPAMLTRMVAWLVPVLVQTARAPFPSGATDVAV